MAFLKNKQTLQFGFSLIDILVAGTILIIMSGALLSNFSKAKPSLTESANIIIGAIRKAEVKATSSALYNGYHPCGYGAILLNSNSVAIYVGPNVADTENCAIRKYDPDNGYAIIETVTIVDPRVEILNNPGEEEDLDVFFIPPRPETCLNGLIDISGHCPADNNARMIISRKSQEICSGSDCKTICVYGTGRIDVFSNQVACAGL
jgi:hypothetical protein